jgi:hypothetical protein
MLKGSKLERLFVRRKMRKGAVGLLLALIPLSGTALAADVYPSNTTRGLNLTEIQLPDDLIRHQLEEHGLLVSPPAFNQEDRRGFFVYIPDGFEELVQTLQRTKGVSIIAHEEGVSAALLEVGSFRVSVSETWMDWATIIFRPANSEGK